MTISMFQATVPPLLRALNNLSHVLNKGAAHAEAKKIEPAVLIQSRLFPDMFPLARQVQIVSDVAKGGVARLAGVEPPKFDDNESTFAELQSRIDKTAAFLKTMKPAQIDGSENREITLAFPSITLNYKGQSYLTDFVLPNVYFHVTTAYNILRHNGVELGKQDFLGRQ
jgi:hypothetical protein